MEPAGRRSRPEEGDFPEEEEVDPRIQGELEKLNQSTDDINRRETELEPQMNMKTCNSIRWLCRWKKINIK